MDEIVKQAMAKWPNVPHCYGWLGLDARGDWRMRDQRAQALQLAGDKIAHAALIAFINRNYQANAEGEWYFQNGPQRVYVNLAATPFILRYDSQSGLTDHTGAPWQQIDAAWLGTEGKLVLEQGEKVGQLDDRDLLACMALFQLDGKELTEEHWQQWLEGVPMALMLQTTGKVIAVQRLPEQDLASHFGFCALPQAR